jgi:hypothetical protein
MAVPTSYLTSTKNLDGILEAIAKAGVPQKFTYDFLKKLGFPSSADRPLIAVLKALGFLDVSGVPLDRYRRFRDPNLAGAATAEGMREAYADVFAVDQNPQDMTNEQLKGVFSRISGKSDSVAEKMAMTFKALAKHSNFDAPVVDREPVPDGSAASLPDGTEAPADAVGVLGMNLRHDIHIHLPVSTEIEVYDAIFRALRQSFGE